MTKVFCDRCGIEMSKDEDNFMVDIKELHYRELPRSLDVCRDCIKKILDK